MLGIVTLVAGMALAAEAPPPPPGPWTGSVGLGVVAATGNARSLTANANSAVEYKVTDWILAGRASGTYGESRIAGTNLTQVTAKDAALFLRGDRRFTPRLSAYALAGFEADHPKSIEIRYSQELGVGYAWIDRPEGDGRLLLRTDLGFRVAEEYRFQYFPVRSRVEGDYPYILTAPRAAAALRYEVNKSVLLSEDVEVLSNLHESRWLANSTTKLTVKLLESLGIGVAYQVMYDSAPAEPKIPWDTKLAITLEYLL